MPLAFGSMKTLDSMYASGDVDGAVRSSVVDRDLSSNCFWETATAPGWLVAACDDITCSLYPQCGNPVPTSMPSPTSVPSMTPVGPAPGPASVWEIAGIVCGAVGAVSIAIIFVRRRRALGAAHADGASAQVGFLWWPLVALSLLR